MWSWVTLSWMFTSFVIHLGIFCFRWIKKKLGGKTACPEPESSKVTRDKGTSILIWFEKIFCQVFIEENFTEVCYHVPFVQTGRNLYHAWRLYKLGYGRPDFDVSKSSEVEAILREVGLAGQYECFFESGPQSITQCVIILSTGRITTMQMVSLTISVFSLTWGAGRSFFIQREDHMADPDHQAVMVLARAFFYMFTVTLNSLLLWTFVVGTLGRYTVVAVVLSFSTVYTSVRCLGRREDEEEEKEEGEPNYFCLKAAICAVWVPSVQSFKKIFEKHRNKIWSQN